MKNLLILGAARGGKSTLARMVNQKFGHGIIAVDAFVSALQETFPQVGITHHSHDAKKVAPFVFAYLNALEYNHPEANFVVEGYHIPLSLAAEKINRDLLEVVVLGYPKLTAEEAFDNVRKYEQKFDYTRAMSDEEILNMVKRHIDHSKEFASECQKYNFSFVDTSYNRTQVLEDLLIDLEQKLIF